MSLTIPNLLSLARMGMVPLFIIAVIEGRTWQPLLLFVAAGLTDALDGLIARFWNQQSKLGTYLDPAADKLLLVAAYASLAVPGLGREVTIPIWITVLVIARDVLIVIVALILYLALGISRFPPAWVSKVTTAVQIIAVLLVLMAGTFPAFAETAELSLLLVALLTIVSGLNYMYLANRMVAEVKQEEA